MSPRSGRQRVAQGESASPGEKKGQAHEPAQQATALVINTMVNWLARS